VEVKKRLEETSDADYENDVAVVVAKILRRGNGGE